MTFKRGRDAKLYYSTTALDTVGGDTPEAIQTASGWTEIDDAQDVTLNTTANEVEVETRGRSWASSRASGKKASIDFTIIWDPSDAAFQALHDAYLNESSIAMACLDDASSVSGAEGLAANMQVLSFVRNEPLGGPVTANVTVKPYSEAQWWVKS